MNIIMTAILAFVIGFTGSSTPASQAPSQAPFMGLTQVLHAQRAQAPTLVTCDEDQPCWDCKTMGNLICGPVQAPTEAPTEAPAPMDTITAPIQPTASPEPAYTPPTQPYMAPVQPYVAPQAPTATVQPVATCTAPTLMAEDGSCVNPNFWGDAKGVTPTVNPIPTPHAEPAPTQASTVAPASRICLDIFYMNPNPADPCQNR